MIRPALDRRTVVIPGSRRAPPRSSCPLRVNGITDFFLTKLDVLSGLEKVPICVAYEVDGVRHDEMPMTQTAFHHAKPVYEEVPGWFEDIGHCRTFDELPANAQAYILRLEKLSGAYVSVIGVGPGRDQNVIRRDLLAQAAT